jgi:hypothetical protein
MAVPQNTIAIVYDYDQTLSPNYMQERFCFLRLGSIRKSSGSRSQALVKEQGFDQELHI